MDLPGQYKMLCDQSDGQKDAQKDQKELAGAAFFHRRSSLIDLRQRLIHGQGDLHIFLEGIAVGILTRNCDCAAVASDGIGEGGEGQLGLLGLAGGDGADQNALDGFGRRGI